MSTTTARPSECATWYQRSAALLLVLAPAIATAGLEFEPRIAIGTTYIDNIELATDAAAEEEEYVGQVYPGFYLLSEGTRHRVEFDYTLQALFYLEDSDRDQIDHDGAARAELTLVDSWFYLNADGQYTQQLVDPLRPVPSNNLFDVGNLSDVTSASVTPSLRHDFSQARLELSYLAGRVNYSGTDTQGNELDDTRNDEIRALLESRSEEAPLTWRAEYYNQEADYDFSLPFEYESAEAELGLRLTSSIRLVGIGGIESDLLTDPEPGGLDEEYWLAGFRWRQDPVGEFEILVGERFFGDAYRFRWERNARILRMSLSYDERPTTAAQDLALSRVQIDPSTVYEPSDDYTSITAEAYINKAFDGTIALIGRRTELELSGFSYRRDYVPSGEEENVVGGGLRIVRRTGARSELSLRAEYRDNEIRNSEPYDDVWGVIGWELRIQPTLLLGVRAGHQERSGAAGYDANWVTLGMEKTF
jgi:hypothetical protein